MLSFLILCSLIPSFLAQPTVCEKDLQALVDAQLATGVEGTLWGVSIGVLRPNVANQVDSWTRLVGASNNELQYFPPASNTKLFATASIYELLGPDFHFQTPIQVLDVDKNPKIMDELCVGAIGDPSFNYSSLVNIVNVLNRLGTMNITKLSIDTSYFIGDYPVGDWEWGDLVYDYGALPSAAVLNEQWALINIKPGSMVGDPLVATYVGPGIDKSVLTIDTSQTKTRGSGTPLTVDVKYFPASEVLYVTGYMAISSVGENMNISVLNPDTHFGNVFKSLLLNSGIAVGSLATGPTACSFNPHTTLPDGAYTLTTIESDRLASLLNYTLLESDNLYAELFLRTLGARYGDTAETTLDNGIKVISSTVNRYFNVTANYYQYDGSGLSRHNLISPLALRQLVEGIWAQTWGSDFEALLPTGGETGTLANRFNGTPAQGKVHAKTGSFSGTSALTGYVDNANYQQVAFSIISGACPCTGAALNNVMDPIVVALAELSPC